MYRSSEIPRNKKTKIFIEGLLSRYTVNHRLADSLIVWSPRQSRGHSFITPLPPPPPPRYGHPTMECFHSRGGQTPCKLIGTKESVCIRKEFNCHRTGLGHKHGRRFIVLGHQYGRLHVKTLYYGHRKPTRHFKHTDITDTLLLQSPR